MQKYNTIIGIIEFRTKGISFSIVESRFNVGSGTAQKVMMIYKSLGFSLEELKGKNPEEVEELFYPKDSIRRKDAALPDFQKIYDKIHSPGSKANITFCWYDYREANPEGYGLTQFTNYYNKFVRDHYGTKDVSMPIERVPGEKLYIDWVGDTPKILIDQNTGELKPVHIFTTTLGFSSCVYARCSIDEQMKYFIEGLTGAINFYGCLPKYFVPDNLKTAITKHTKDTLQVNTLFSDLERFYSVIVIPPLPRKPKGKPTVEEHVKFLETHLIEKLKQNIYNSIDEINRETEKIIYQLNNRKEKRSASRFELFEKYDKPSMRPVSFEQFNICDYKPVNSIPDNYHIEYDDHYYSVSFTEHGKPAILKATYDKIEICDQYNRKLTEHKRVYSVFPKYITKDEHMPKEHLYYKNVNSRDGSYYRNWAKKFGNNMFTFIDLLLRKAEYEPQAYNSCMGILQNCEKKPYTLVEEAAEQCLKANTVYYSAFNKALSKVAGETNEREEEYSHKHKNIRGKENYR